MLRFVGSRLAAGRFLGVPFDFVLAVVGLFAVAVAGTTAQAAETNGAPSIKSRNMDVSRAGAADRPRSEGDQVLHDGWPLYRSDRGQTAFNDAMATLKATIGRVPDAAVFKGCEKLHCQLELPALDKDGWLPQGRLWISPKEYVIFAHSPRNSEGKSYRRRSARGMRLFVLHEFANSTRNTDAYDTISAHRSSVFVPLYMSKESTDAEGRRFVVVIQVAPYDVVSTHASNMGSAGPGIEVAKNYGENLEPLQGLAGIAVATIIKTAAPQLRVVNHRGTEGRPMLDLFEARLAALKQRDGQAAVALPFVPAEPERIASATGELAELIQRPGLSPPIAVAERTFMPRKVAIVNVKPAAPDVIDPVPTGTPGGEVATAAKSAEAMPVVDETLMSRMRVMRTSWLNEEVGTSTVPRLVGPIRLATRPEHDTGRGADRPVGTVPKPVFLRAGAGS